jgi:chemotaxis protein methyltransferase CheR
MNVFRKPVMHPEEFRLISEFIADEFGLVIDENRCNYLTPRLLLRLEELRLESFADYYACLKFSPHGSAEHQQLISLLTNNETYFFREDAQLQVLASHILPEIKAKKQLSGKKQIRLLSAGCSSGEEVYTLAMILLESGLFLWDWDIMVTGIDIDPVMIAKARAGIYSGRAFQTTQPQYLDRYFSKCAEGYQVKETLRRITRFEEGNLLKLDHLKRDETADAVFCRNVVIYFSDDTTKKIVESFTELLAHEGHLFLGHSESLSRITSHFVPVRFPGAIIYKKRTLP